MASTGPSGSARAGAATGERDGHDPALEPPEGTDTMTCAAFPLAVMARPFDQLKESDGHRRTAETMPKGRL